MSPILRNVLLALRPALKPAIVALGLAGALVGTPRPATGETITLPTPVRGDPADSLYRAAREALNAERYVRAAELFRTIRETVPRSAYVPDTYYWEAFALYRIGGEDALREALRALEVQGRSYPEARTRGDAGALAVRIQGMLARSGDGDAAREVAREAERAGGGSPDACAGDDGSEIAALNALVFADPARASAAVRNVLSRRDPCSAPLRRKAALLAAGSLPGAVAEPILLEVIRTDPDPEVRRAALLYAGVLPGDRPVGIFEEVLRHSTEPELQTAAISGLALLYDPRAGEILREVVERPGWSEGLKERAIRGLGLSPSNAPILHGAYAVLTQASLRRAVLVSLGDVKTAENRRWLLERAADRSTDLELRKIALSSAAQWMDVGPLLDLYREFQDIPLRKQLLFVYANRREPAVADRLAEIAERDLDPGIRETALFWLRTVKRAPGADRIPDTSPDSAERH